MIDTIKNILGQELDDLHTAAPARIEKYDPKRMVAEVTLLYKDKDKKVIPPIVEVPVSMLKTGPFFIRPPYKKDDIVLVVFSERALDYILQQEPQEIKTGTGVRHRIDDAIIVQGVKIDAQPDLPEEYAEDLLIMNQDSSTKAIMTKDGDIIFDVPSNMIYLGKDSTEGVPLGNSLKEWLDSHTHSEPDGVTGPPTSSSPEPSSKVKVIE